MGSCLVLIFHHFLMLGVCIIDDDRLIDHIDDLEGAFTAWQVCVYQWHLQEIYRVVS